MTYSFTEKKRVRRQFGTLPNVMELPYLLKTQTDSYAEFLQADLDPSKRERKGLEEVSIQFFQFIAHQATLPLITSVMSLENAYIHLKNANKRHFICSSFICKPPTEDYG